MGAGVVLELALDRRDLTDMLVLVAPGLPEWDWDPSMADFAEREAAALERGDLTQASWLNVDFWLAGPFRSPDEVDARLRRNVYEMQRRAFELDNPAAEGTWLMADRQERLGNLEAPTLIVVGELDHADFVEVGRHMATRIPDARLEIVPGVAHLPPMETPDRFARLVLDFLNG
jgi:pimeloyl-ACP methyl ester carboxylesterase